MLAFIIVMGVALIIGVFAIVPPLPPVPIGLTRFNEQLEQVLTEAINIIRYVLTPELTFTTVAILIAVYAFEPIYHGVMWILRKIPGLGIQ